MQVYFSFDKIFEENKLQLWGGSGLGGRRPRSRRDSCTSGEPSIVEERRSRLMMCSSRSLVKIHQQRLPLSLGIHPT